MKNVSHTGIQGLRAACVVAVFLYHVINSGLVPTKIEGTVGVMIWFATGMRHGVEIFFMISGYVIVKSLPRHKNIGEFWRGRLLRILPLWIPIASTILLVGWAITIHTGQLAPRALGSFFMFLGSMAILSPILNVALIHPAQWSINYELFFYFFVSISWTLKRNGKYFRVCWILVAITTSTLFPRSIFFWPGILVAAYEPFFFAKAAWFRFGWIGLPLAWVAWLETDVDRAQYSRTLFDIFLDGSAASAALAFFSAIAFFAWIVLWRRADSDSILNHPSMQWLGKISFSFYLIHPIVLAGVKRAIIETLGLGWLSALILILLSLPLSCVLSWITYNLLEVQFRRWLEQLPQHIRTLRFWH